ncbi:recombinase family protein [Peptostreptococcaceae bacterium OttesenSCG-928-C18]|nr:recombinase family protein [Peptostreptococcaceae bacterium OttesenSCG-928-C18]
MRKVTKIDAAVGVNFLQSKLRVAAYCRVSTDGEDQLSSLENQTTHYTKYIKSNPEWEFAGLYFDEGISGTKKENRSGLQNLIRDCENRQIDFFITKSISRFARNTADCLEIVRKMTDLGIAILFEKENINTGTMDSELILSILSSLAAEESVSISQNNKWSVKRRFENGTFKLSNPPYGYDYNGETIVPNAERVPIVKRIFAEVLAGNGVNNIARMLNAEGILSQNGKLWSSSAVKGILTNEKYIGDVLLQKTYTDDHFTRHYNNGEMEQYYWENHHEAIISREDFEAVAYVLKQHSKEKGIQKGSDKYLNRYPFSGIILCGECGDTLKRRTLYRKTSSPYIVWGCGRHTESRGTECTMLDVKEEHIKAAFVTMLNRLYSGRNVILKPLIAELKSREGDENSHKLMAIEKQIQENLEQVQVLTGLMSKGYLEPALFNERNNALQTESMKLRMQKVTIQSSVTGEQSHIHEAEELLKYLNKTGVNENYSDDVFIKFADGITVFTPTEVGFRLKCGLVLRERMAR